MNIIENFWQRSRFFGLMFNIVHVRKTLWIAVTLSRKNGRENRLDFIRENEALEIWSRKIRKTINFIKNEQKEISFECLITICTIKFCHLIIFSGWKVHLRRDSVKESSVFLVEIRNDFANISQRNSENKLQDKTSRHIYLHLQ